MVVKSTNFLTKLPFRFYTVHYVRVGLDTSSFVNVSFNRNYFKELFCNDQE